MGSTLGWRIIIYFSKSTLVNKKIRKIDLISCWKKSKMMIDFVHMYKWYQYEVTFRHKYQIHCLRLICWVLLFNIFIRRNVGICNHFICNYMRLCVVYNYFCNYLPTSPIWGGFATILLLLCNYYLFHLLMWMLLGLYLSMNKPPWPISWMCNQNFVTNSCTMCIMGMISTHIWGCTIHKVYLYYNMYLLWILSTYL